MTGNQKIRNFAAVILAAGNSSRMGKPKYALKFDDNHTFAEKIISNLFQVGCEKIALVLNSNDIQNFKKKITSEESGLKSKNLTGFKNLLGLTSISYDLIKSKKMSSKTELIDHSRITVVENPNPEAGRFSSIKLGLEMLKFQGNVFIINVDNPLYQKETLIQLAEKSSEAEVIIPVFHGQKGHPVLISQPVVQKVLLQTMSDLPFREFLNGFQQYYVEVHDENILVNINTPEDYETHFTNR